MSASDAAALISAHISSSEPQRPGAVIEKYGAGPSGYTWVNRQEIQPPPQIFGRAASTVATTSACSSGNPDQVHAVSNVSEMIAIDASASRAYGARTKLDRHALTESPPRGALSSWPVA